MKLAAVDLGASGGRVLLGTLYDGADGAALSIEEIHRFPHGGVFVPTDHGHTLHWDVVRLWEEIQLGLRKLGHQHGRPDSIGVDTWGVDFGLLDRDGALIANPVCYRDARTDRMVEEAFRLVPRAEIFRRTGIQFMPLNTVFQLMGFTRRQPHLVPLVDRMLMMPDLFHYWLCGSKTNEWTNASTSQLANPQQRDWDRPLMHSLDLPPTILPEIVEPGTRLGTLRSSVADETDLAISVPVICPATHDTASAVVATPGEGDDWAFLSAGTWCLFGAEVSRPYLQPEVLQYGFGNEGGVRGTTRLLRNITGLWLVQECRRYWRSEGHEFDWSELAQLAAEARPFTAFLDPDDAGFAHPTRMPQAIEQYCRRSGQSSPSTPGEFVRTCLEGIALTVRLRWEQLESLLGRRLSCLHIVGGGTQNELLCQLIADALGKPVLAGPTEATGMGNALVQAIGLGAMDYDEARQVVRRSVQLRDYEPRETSLWEDAFGRYQAHLAAKGA